MSAKRALITGITGQDGSYLADFLLQLGYEVHGVVRRAPSERFERLDHIRDQVVLHQGDLAEERSLRAALAAAQPDEVYNLAGTSAVAASWAHPALCADVTAAGVTRMLDAVRDLCPGARFYQASSGEMFGRAAEVPQTERTPVCPRSPHAAAKAYGHFLTVAYREAYGLHATSGILFNHESPRRGREFVTRKITSHVAAIKLGLASKLRLGNLEGERDWGFAMDYVRAMWMMLQREEPEDFVIATGTTHSVRECLELAFGYAGLSIEEHVELDDSLLRPAEPEQLVGDASKARRILGWEPEVGFEDLIRMMVDADYALLRFEATMRGTGGR
jgi:GDPmannose 4,6-dehydratase